MYEKGFHLEIVTPERVVFKDEATSVSAPGVKGGFQVLHNHAPLLSLLEIGAVKVKDKQGKDTVYATSGGFVEVRDNSVVVLVESAEAAGEIDLDRAKSAEDRAKERLHSKDPSIDNIRAEAALMRAVNRQRIAKTNE